ncbi:PRD domain-containing protein [Bacillus licheniformis]|nr:PRD domain-containing protein [Bacillus licheniformis]
MTMLIQSIKSWKENKRTGIVVAAHGNSTASSMVEVATELLGSTPIAAVDMPLTVSPYAEHELDCKFDRKFIYFLSMHIAAFLKRGKQIDVLNSQETDEIRETHVKEYEVALIFKDKIQAYFKDLYHVIEEKAKILNKEGLTKKQINQYILTDIHLHVRSFFNQKMLQNHSLLKFVEDDVIQMTKELKGVGFLNNLDKDEVVELTVRDLPDEIKEDWMSSSKNIERSKMISEYVNITTIISPIVEDEATKIDDSFMTVHIPSLNERSLGERVELTTFLLGKEAERIKKNLNVHIDVYNALIHSAKFGNVGQLKSNVQLVCAQGAFCLWMKSIASRRRGRKCCFIS